MFFGVEKLEWCGYPMVKNFEDTFISFKRIQERDRQTARRADGLRDEHRATAWPRLCIVSRGKNDVILMCCHRFPLNFH